MQGEGQNAMLKLLEEGPTYAAFVLLARNGGALLTTVRSRCEELRLAAEDTSRDEELFQKAGQLADRWLAGDEDALMDLCVPLEKGDRQQILMLLGYLRQQLCDMLATHPDRRTVLRGISLVEQLLQAAERNVGTGHLLGWLCAQARQTN